MGRLPHGDPGGFPRARGPNVSDALTAVIAGTAAAARLHSACRLVEGAAGAGSRDGSRRRGQFRQRLFRRDPGAPTTTAPDHSALMGSKLATPFVAGAAANQPVYRSGGGPRTGVCQRTVAHRGRRWFYLPARGCTRVGRDPMVTRASARLQSSCFSGSSRCSALSTPRRCASTGWEWHSWSRQGRSRLPSL